MANEEMQEQKPKPAPQESEGGGEGAGGASQAIEQIQAGFQTLQGLMQQAQGQLSPEDLELFQQAVSATDAFVQSISGPVQEQAPPPGAQQSGPMAAHANAGARPSGY